MAWARSYPYAKEEVRLFGLCLAVVADLSPLNAVDL